MDLIKAIGAEVPFDQIDRLANLGPWDPHNRLTNAQWTLLLISFRKQVYKSRTKLKGAG
ncbi:hypothetical protein MAR_028982 [Mya arenaria]|uniref:Uncharacterized protein n=1 Tax=Mya arenaria TaxID=6604 RepID=A0ABY7DF56_MYAAR|nr:hypothetical protein MAR_028982 [Mya arenaria]